MPDKPLFSGKAVLKKPVVLSVGYQFKGRDLPLRSTVGGPMVHKVLAKKNHRPALWVIDINCD